MKNIIINILYGLLVVVLIPLCVIAAPFYGLYVLGVYFRGQVFNYDPDYD